MITNTLQNKGVISETGFIQFEFVTVQTFSSDLSGQSTTRLQRWLILTQVPSSQVNLLGKQVVRVMLRTAPPSIC